MNAPSLPNEWIARLFSRLQAIYGNRVQTMWGKVDPTEVRQVWAESLARFEGSDLREAIENVMGAYPDYPPTLPQFMGLCMDAKRKRAQETQKLPPPKTEIPEHIRTALREFVEKAKGHG
jgi:hypothetical protein